MGIIFGTAIVYVMSKLVAAQRRICFLEDHMTRKADKEELEVVRGRVVDIETNTDTFLNSFSSDIKELVVSLCAAPEPEPGQAVLPPCTKTDYIFVPPPRLPPTPPVDVQEEEEAVEEEVVVETEEAEAEKVDAGVVDVGLVPTVAAPKRRRKRAT